MSNGGVQTHTHTQKKQPNKILLLDATKFRLTLFFIYCTLLKKQKKTKKKHFQAFVFFLFFFFLLKYSKKYPGLDA